MIDNDYDVVAEDGNARVILRRDDCPDEPYDDGASPLIRFERSGYWGLSAEQVTSGTSYRLPENVIHAAERFGRDTFLRYLRIFHGMRSHQKYGPNGHTYYEYLTFDTQSWREEMGIDGVEHNWTDAQRADLANMDEYIAYLEGDVYDYTIQEREVDAAGMDESGDWVDTDESCGGFYGDEWARQAALEALGDFIAERMVQV